MKTNPFLITVGAVASLLSVALVGPAVASEPDNTIIVGGLSAAKLTQDAAIDLDTFAHQNGLDSSRIRTQFAGQEQFALLSTQLEQDQSSTYAGAALTWGDSFDGWLAFTARPSAEVISLIDTLPLRVEVRWDAPASALKLANEQESLYRSVLAIPGVALAEVSNDPLKGRLSLAYSIEGFNYADAVSRAISSILAKSSVPVDVAIDASLEAVSLIASHGGESISNCTAGFSITYAGGSPGVSTAGHCNNTSTAYNGVSSAYVGEVFNSSYDVQWHSVLSGGITNTFRYTTGGGIRSATSTISPVVGQSICYYGKSTGNHCSTVTNANMCPSGGSCNSFELSGALASGGDSGGPAYFSNSAAGYIYATGPSHDYGQRISSLTSNGVFVRITP